MNYDEAEHFILIPVFNEEKNLPALFSDLKQLSADPQGKYKIFIVDDGSTDNSPRMLNDFHSEFGAVVIRNAKNEGIGNVLSKGIRAVLAAAGDRDSLTVIEGDSTSDLKILPAMIEKLYEGYEVIIASRFLPDGGYQGFPFFRKCLSMAGNSLYGLLSPVRNVRDYTIFYRTYSVLTMKKYLDSSRKDIFSVRGFAANVELLYLLNHQGIRITSVPLKYLYQRKRNSSKMKIISNIFESLELIARYRVNNLKDPA